MPKILQKGEYYGATLKTVDLDPFVVTITHCSPLDVIENHYHESQYVSMLLHGGYQEKSRKENEWIQPGNVIYRPSLYDHANRISKNGGLCLNLEIKNAGSLSDFYDRLPGKMQIFNVSASHSLFQLYTLLIGGQSESDLFEKALESFSCIANARTSGDSWISKIQTIIDKEPGNHTLASLADRVCVHPIYMANAFRKKTGLTIGEYQLKVKLRLACHLLLKDKMTIYQIAAAAGFHDAAHFVKTFRYHFGKTPHQIRLHNRKLIRYNFQD